MPKIARIAPTPSGFLHFGNAYNFVLTAMLARFYHAKLGLRIDDYDQIRTKPQYIDFIFKTIDQLKIKLDFGASSTDEFYRKFSSKHRIEIYKKELENFPVFACSCSHKTLSNCTCSGLNFEPFKTNLKLSVNLKPIFVSRKKYLNFSLDKFITDTENNGNLDEILPKQQPILWQKQNSPSFCLASLVDDKILKTDLFVRGEDLFQISSDSIRLGKFINLHLNNAIFFHHKMFLKDGVKISKSSKAAPFENKNELFNKICDDFNIKRSNNLDDIISRFIETRNQQLQEDF